MISNFNVIIFILKVDIKFYLTFEAFQPNLNHAEELKNSPRRELNVAGKTVPDRHDGITQCEENMGITLNYTAELKSPKLLPELLKEVKALAKEAGWKVKRIKPEAFKVPDMPPLHVEGVLLNIHPECEPVNLVFDSKGKMASYQWLELCRSFEADARIFEMAKQTEVMLIGPGGQMQKKNLWSMVEMDVGVRYAGTKTQFAGPAVHIAICKLLRYLAKKYFKSIDVSDESDYW